MNEEVILVDEQDKMTGIEEKIKAHREGRLHRAFSIFIFNSKGEMLLQKRASGKYHSARLWTNACCSHPRPGEGTKEAALRRLKEEMGFVCDLDEAFDFIYRVEFGNGLWEYEYDHVFLGKHNGKINADKKEVEEWKWTTIESLKKDIAKNPENYTYWLKVSIDRLKEYLKKNKINYAQTKKE